MLFKIWRNSLQDAHTEEGDSATHQRHSGSKVESALSSRQKKKTQKVEKATTLLHINSYIMKGKYLRKMRFGEDKN